MTERRKDGTLGQEQRELTLPVIDVPSFRPSVALPVLDQRLRGTKFVSLAPKSILNSPQATGMDFWSINPYVGCEFGCTYCYARYAHRYVVERAHDQRRLSDEEFRELDRKSTRLNSSHGYISYAVFCLKKKKQT